MVNGKDRGAKPPIRPDYAPSRFPPAGTASEQPAGRGAVLTAEPGTVLVLPGTPCTGIFLLLSGAFTITYADGTSRLCEDGHGAEEHKSGKVRRHMIESQRGAIEDDIWTGRITVQRKSRILFWSVRTMLLKHHTLESEISGLHLRQDSLGEFSRRIAELEKTGREQMARIAALDETNARLNERVCSTPQSTPDPLVIARMRAELALQDKELAAQAETLTALQAQIAERDAHIAALATEVLRRDERIRVLEEELTAALETEAPSPEDVGAELIEEGPPDDSSGDRQTFDYGLEPFDGRPQPPPLPSVTQAGSGLGGTPTGLGPRRAPFSTLLGIQAAPTSGETTPPSVRGTRPTQPSAGVLPRGTASPPAEAGTGSGTPPIKPPATPVELDLDWDDPGPTSERRTLMGVPPPSSPAPSVRGPKR